MLKDLSRCAVHTITTKPWPFEIAVEKFARAGAAGISVWREALQGRSPAEARRRIRDAGLSTVAYVRAGFFPSVEAAERKAKLAEAMRALDEAAELGAPLLIMVCGADPRQSLEASRGQIREGLAAMLPAAAERGVKLAVEPLHPMFADTRSAITTLKQANDLCEELPHPALCVAVDVYHLWWDPELEKEIARCGRLSKLATFHVCDWKSPTVDMLNDRGLMGEGCIDIPRIRGWVEKTGYQGMIEVEIFSNIYWAMDQDKFLGMVVDAYKKHV